MNKFRFGNPELTIMLWLVGFFPLVLILGMNPPMIIFVCIVASCMFTFFSACWMPYLVTKYHLRPAIDKCGANETTWCRTTKDSIIIPQFVDKGPYGQTKGVTFKEKADVMDDGSFPIRWLNGNPGIIVYDLMNTNVNLKKSVARKKMKLKFGVRSGVEGYNKAKQEGKVMFND